MTRHLIVPMVFYVFYIWLLAFNNFRVRKKAVIEKHVKFSDYKTNIATMPDDVTVAGRHYDNQFQVPILFFTVCAIHLSLGLVNQFTLALAWVFVATRLGHSYEHLGRNRVMRRVYWFSAGWAAVVSLWLQLCYLMFQ